MIDHNRGRNLSRDKVMHFANCGSSPNGFAAVVARVICALWTGNFASSDGRRERQLHVP
jgi:hypothetical protein